MTSRVKGKAGAAALIAAARAKSTGAYELSEAAIADVEEICAYNRTAHRLQRVRAQDVLQMLADVHDMRISRDALDDWCRRKYGVAFGSVGK